MLPEPLRQHFECSEPKLGLMPRTERTPGSNHSSVVFRLGGDVFLFDFPRRRSTACLAQHVEDEARYSVPAHPKMFVPLRANPPHCSGEAAAFLLI